MDTSAPAHMPQYQLLVQFLTFVVNATAFFIKARSLFAKQDIHLLLLGYYQQE